MQANANALYDPGLLDGLDEYFYIPGKKYWAEPTRGLRTARINEPYPGNRQNYRKGLNGLGWITELIGGAIDIYGAKTQLKAQESALKTQLAVAEKKRQAMELQLAAAKQAKEIALLEQASRAKSAQAGLGIDLKTLVIPAVVIGGGVLAFTMLRRPRARPRVRRRR